MKLAILLNLCKAFQTSMSGVLSFSRQTFTTFDQISPLTASTSSDTHLFSLPISPLHSSYTPLARQIHLDIGSVTKAIAFRNSAQHSSHPHMPKPPAMALNTSSPTKPYPLFHKAFKSSSLQDLQAALANLPLTGLHHRHHHQHRGSSPSSHGTSACTPARRSWRCWRRGAGT